ncbi:ParB/RepB/Spo0J family partition protein [Pseudokordiimonas caeni]|uniref:ParB/RepB/Spo0J family partition protein n=1 Tax=Pseudokordiimonas caeni TaxID=2997908 RepID=UPI002811B8B2|nr:ParB/RepB/Spo0J family partition protein [Pseudokordiimonas caeni]
MQLGAKPKKGLGKGLSALLADDRPQVVAAQAAIGDASRRVLPIAFLERNNAQPRNRFDDAAIAELTASIKEKGVLQPILVRPMGGDRFQIVAGERRWRAAQKAGIHEVPVVVRELSDSEVLEIAIVENVQRQDLSAIEEATAYKRLIDEFGHTQETAAEIVGKSRSHVANLMRLLLLPTNVQDMVNAGAISMGHARALIGAADAEEIAKRIVKEGLSVRQTEVLANEAKGRPAAPKARGLSGTGKAKDADTVALEKDLSAATGMKVTIEHGGGADGEGGVVTIRYETLDQLDDLCGRLGVCGI